MSAWRRLRTAGVVSVLAAGVLVGTASPGPPAAAAGESYRIENERCEPYDHYRCERLPE